MRKLGLPIAIGAALIGIATPAAATDPLHFTFDTDDSYVHVTENGRSCLPFSGCKLSASLLGLNDVSIGLGDSFTFDFAQFGVSAGFGGDSDAQIDAALAFTSPDADPASSGATVSYLRLGGFFTPGAVVGSLTWDNAITQIQATDGSLFTVQFNDLSGVVFGSTAKSSVTITVDRIGRGVSNDNPSNAGGAVPEPASWALMLGGFGMIGGLMRNSRGRTGIRFA